MVLEEERRLVVEYGKKLITNGLTKGTGGNISVFNREKQLMAISPSGIEYFKTNVEDVVVMGINGEVVDGHRKPSSEYEMHRIFYERDGNVNAVVHTHSTYSSILACLNWDMEPVHYLIGFAGPNVRCTKYKPFGTRELAESAFEGMKERKAVLLGNHGLLAVGSDIASAFNTAEEVEFCAEIYYKTRCVGNPAVLSSEDINVVLEKFKTYGQK
ncbi:MAG: fuculose phosphate aldolase [Clostridiaceae bacterium]|jgi:L-fuculose-phosphate aldolase|nr:fuculose phosphate aldolase [Clostridiaceae bacterium]